MSQIQNGICSAYSGQHSCQSNRAPTASRRTEMIGKAVSTAEWMNALLIPAPASSLAQTQSKQEGNLNFKYVMVQQRLHRFGKWLICRMSVHYSEKQTIAISSRLPRLHNDRWGHRYRSLPRFHSIHSSIRVVRFPFVIGVAGFHCCSLETKLT